MDWKALIEVPKLSTVEYHALYDFYNATHGSSWYWHNVTEFSVPWNFSNPNADPCHDHWQGLVCDCEKTSCFIQVMYLDHHNLTGYLPDSIGDFTQMEYLSLRGNNITSTIPVYLGNLTALNRLDLSYNLLEGDIPASISNLQNLTSLFLSFNRFVSIPEELYLLSNLQLLNLYQNRIEGYISPRIANLSNLIALELQINKFFPQPFPKELCHLRKLQSLDFSHNAFSGPFPDCFWQMTNLTAVSLYYTNLSCTLSDQMGNLVNLISFEIANSNMYGSIPASIGNLTKLINLEINDNHFTGTLPITITNLKVLTGIFVFDNMMHGPVDFLSVMNVYGFYIHDNFFTGPLDLMNSGLSSPIYFDVSENLLSGSLPWNNVWRDIIIYEANRNYFQGALPAVGDVSVPALLYFLINDNYLTSSLPEGFLSDSKALFYFDISMNCFTGTLPNSLGFYYGLNQLNISQNYFQGRLPESISNDDFLVVIDVSQNRLTGSIPIDFSQLRFIEELFIQDNIFTGNINELINSTIQQKWVNIDLSSNQFTGSIPTSLFLTSPNLVSFASSSNCLKGLIPEEICQAHSLVSLSLDGLTTAENCRESLFPGIVAFDGFTVAHFLQSSIPSCLFEMSSMELLHLSGNGLTGSIPSDVTITSSLTDLSLSHNSLTGTIPIQIQTRSWINLDLSYNKLSGTLASSFAPPMTSGSLSLQVNRLSGPIPSSLQSAANVTMLTGNIFGCDFDGSDLPTSDPDSNNYSCGSDAANDVLYAWIAVVVSIPVILLMLFRGFKQSSSSTRWIGNILWEKGIIWREQLRSQKDRINLIRLSIYFSEIRRGTIKLAVYCIFILLPVFSILKINSSSYEVEYAWSISGMLMNGEVAAITLFIVLGIFAAFYFIVIKRLLQRIEERMPRGIVHTVEKSQKSTAAVDLNNSDSISYPSSISSLTPESDWKRDTKSTSSGISIVSENTFEIVIVYLLVSILDLVIMGVADFSYVYIVITYDELIVSLSAFCLAFFRLMTNNLILWYALPQTCLFFFWMKAKLGGTTTTTKTAAMISRRLHSLHYSSRDISFLENLTLVNNILIPGIAIIFILPDCFYNALFAADHVSSSYTYNSCFQYAPISGTTHICHSFVSVDTYSPPYLYSYQCSSKIVINYVPVYVMLLILAGVIVPAMKISCKLYYDALASAASGSTRIKIRKYLELVLPEYMKDLRSHGDVSVEIESGTLTPSKVLEEGREPREEDITTGKGGRTWRQTLSLWLKRREDLKEKRLFSKLTMTVQINSYLTILMCFGALFPPLALITAISILSITYYEELWIGWLLEKTRKLGIGYTWYEEELERESEGVEESSNLTIWSTLVVSCSLYGYIIFDTMGDESGWKAALPMTLLMVLMPLLLMLCERMFHCVRKTTFVKENKYVDKSAAEPVITSTENPLRSSSVQMVSTDRASKLMSPINS